MFGRKKDDGVTDMGSDSERAETHDYEPSKAQIKRATRQRFIWALLSSLLLLISVVFLILVEIGNTSISSTLNKIWFIRLDLSDIIPVSVPNAVLINSIAQSLGLHDFYTVGLWNYCEGYNGQGVTHCSPPETLYWFNPVAIVQSQLLAGATIALPAEVNDILDLIRLVSTWMFGLFLTGLVLDFVVIFLLPLSVFTRWLSLPLSIITFIAAFLTTAAAIIASVMFIIMQQAITSATDLNIRASIGTHMFVFMWIAAVASVLALAIQLGMCCCCASRRDVRTGRRMGSKKAWTTTTVDGEPSEKRRWPTFGKNKRET
ncbi:hypothetical protein CERZMDRAFT_99509 [Cercospora zeae-maydis SCOH1-5]|uniref:SUR7 protein n=1 Tax=Cercospora zeae-maydis SCOH1-5 TaxID=717836 RepID=A0A6A6FAI8_9PEZI|nr:hypothetical protein CERZMDRAFT_99509 [Cercospora zeae-maydis SCOH1-5]